MIVDHVVTAKQFALALQNIGELYARHLGLARIEARLPEWKLHIAVQGVKAYRRSVKVPFAITEEDLDRAAVLMRDYYAARIAEGV